MKFIQSWWDINEKGSLSEKEIKLIELSRLTLEYNLDSRITFYTNLNNLSGFNYTDIKPLNVVNQPKDIWCMGKLIAMAQQTEPFIHLDTDVFLWKKTDHKKFEKPFLVFHHECWMQKYMHFAQQIPPPPSLKGGYDYFNSNNFGLIGGVEWRAIVEAAQEVLDHVQKHQEQIVSIGKEHESGQKRLMWTPVLLEQVWMSEILTKKGIEPQSFLGDRRVLLDDFYKPDLDCRAKSLGIAHFWSNTKDKHEQELLDAYEKWSKYIQSKQ